MKKPLQILLLVSILALSAAHASAQAWQRDSKVLSLGIGASDFFHIDRYYYNYNGVGYDHSWYTPVTGQINFQGEFGIHKYVGLGFTTGIGGRGSLYSGYGGEMNIPIGMIANFHFFQLISDRTGKSIHADKVDVYAGANIGSGIAIAYYSGDTRLEPIVFGGLHVGVRYYFAPKIGVNAELGWGKSIVNAGLVFKL